MRVLPEGPTAGTEGDGRPEDEALGRDRVVEARNASAKVDRAEGNVDADALGNRRV